jgi:hypothetical protein
VVGLEIAELEGEGEACMTDLVEALDRLMRAVSARNECA